MDADLRRREVRECWICAAIVICMAAGVIGAFLFCILYVNPPPQVLIYSFTLSPKLNPDNATASPPPISSNCTITLAFDNNIDAVDLYEEIEVSVVRGYDTLMVAYVDPFCQGELEQKPVVVSSSEFPLEAPPGMRSSVYDSTYSFGVNVRSRVRTDPDTEKEVSFYIEAVCDDVRVGFAEKSEVGTMLQGTDSCRVYRHHHRP